MILKERLYIFSHGIWNVRYLCDGNVHRITPSLFEKRGSHNLKLDNEIGTFGTHNVEKHLRFSAGISFKYVLGAMCQAIKQYKTLG